MSAPSILVIDVDPAVVSSADIVKEIIGTDALPESVAVSDGVTAWPWHVNTKYYTAEVHVCTTQAKGAFNKEFATSVEAIIMIVDTKSVSGLDEAEAWLPHLQLMPAAVKLLLCHKCSVGDPLPREKCNYWCLENNFELVELSPECTEADSDVEDDFLETVGLRRVLEALEANMWPNLLLKAKPTCKPGCSRHAAGTALYGLGLTPADCSDDDISCEACDVTSPDDDDNVISTPLNGGASSIDSDWNLLAGLADDVDDGTFEQLFEKLRIMKDKASVLPPDERRAYAEQVALSFWNAVDEDGRKEDAESGDDG